MGRERTAEEMRYREHYPEEVVDEYDEISIKDLLTRLWSRRSVIFIWTLAIILVIGLVGGAVYLLQARTKEAELRFELRFAGVEKGAYPNGTPFSTGDIISAPVLTQVYEENNLSPYMDFSQFKGSVSIIQTNDAIRLLEYEYAARLSDRKLSVDDRERMEKEFQKKKKDAMAPIYSLRFEYKREVASIPEGVVAEVLNDILRVWADYADRVKGAIEYRMAIVSPNVLDKQALDSEDYLVTIDMMLEAIDRIDKNIGEMLDIPGSNTIRVGEAQTSLNDVQYRLVDLAQIYLKPLTSLIYNSGIYRKKELGEGFIKNRLFELNLEKAGAVSKKGVYDESLKKYVLKGGDGYSEGGLLSKTPPVIAESPSGVPAMIPQFGADFLNSLIQLGQERSDAQFRQEITQNAIDAGIKEVEIDVKARYYKNMLNKITSMGNKGEIASFGNVPKQRADTVLKKAYLQMLDSINCVNAVYNALFKHYLIPDCTLYNMLEPVITKTSTPLSARRMVMFMVLAGVLLEGMLLIGVLAATPAGRPRESRV